MARVVYANGVLADLERLSELLLAEMPDEAAHTTELLFGAIAMLAEHPLLGRGVEQGFRELVISRGRSGYLALYSLEVVGEVVLVAAIRHQREAGYLIQNDIKFLVQATIISLPPIFLQWNHFCFTNKSLWLAYFPLHPSGFA